MNIIFVFTWSSTSKTWKPTFFLTMQERVLCFAGNKLQTISFHFIVKIIEIEWIVAEINKCLLFEKVNVHYPVQAWLDLVYQSKNDHWKGTRMT